MNNKEEEYMTTKEVAKFLHLDTHTIRTRLRKGDFPNAIRPAIGGRRSWLIPKSDVLVLLKIENPEKGKACQ